MPKFLRLFTKKHDRGGLWAPFSLLRRREKKWGGEKKIGEAEARKKLRGKTRGFP